jgi:hypothetical protein
VSDFDGVNPILADIDVKGKPTKALRPFDQRLRYTGSIASALLVAEKTIQP